MARRNDHIRSEAERSRRTHDRDPALLATLTLAIRFARRELRGGIRGFRIFLACLALGVAIIAAVGSLSAALDAGLRHNARALLGGDLDFYLALRPADAPERAWLEARGAVSEAIDLRAMAHADTGDTRSLVEVKAIDGAYPLYGTIELAPAQDLGNALAPVDGVYGAVVAPGLLDRLGLKIGDPVRVGTAVFTVRATLTHEPDAITGAFSFGPKVMIAKAALEATGLIQPGALVGYAYRLRLPPGADVAAVTAAAKAAFPDAGWRIRDFGNAAPTLQQLLDRLTVFLTLVGLTALLVGGVGVGNAVRGYLGGRIETIATLKCLGAPGHLVFATYLAEILVLALLGITLGLVVGALAPLAILPLLPAELPITAEIGIYPLPLVTAAGFGILTTLAFTLWPLASAARIAPATLFRNLITPSHTRPSAPYLVAIALAGLALAALAVLGTGDPVVAGWFILGAAGSLLVFRLAASGLMFAARAAGRPRIPSLRLALANLYRPGATTAAVVASLGLGLTVLVAIALVEGNIAREIGEHLPERAPSFFFIDLQPDEAQAFDDLLHGMQGVSEVSRVPSLRCRIAKLNGIPVEQAVIKPEAQWALRGERGLTYAREVPKGSEVVDGKWWPAGYQGPPLVSFDAGLARGMGLKIGDTITVNVLGRELTATLANTRDIDWTSLGINFTLVMAPGPLDGAPQTFIATARTTPQNEAALERAVTDRFPNVSAIAVKDALQSLSTVIAAIGMAIRATAAITLVAGGLVLAGAIAAEHRRRVYDAVVLKVLGATRADITRAFLLEFGLIGLAATILAAAMGTLAAYLVVTRVMHAAWTFLPSAVATTAVVATLVTLGIGYAGIWRALGTRAAPYLRVE